jgi:methyl-accepting chemotaxis protein
VTEGLTVVNEGGRALTEIQEASDEVAVQVQEISKSFESQADQAGRVVEAITNIVAVSEENASATEEISASTQELTASMESMVAAARQLEGVAQRLKEASARFQ